MDRWRRCTWQPRRFVYRSLSEVGENGGNEGSQQWLHYTRPELLALRFDAAADDQIASAIKWVSDEVILHDENADDDQRRLPTRRRRGRRAGAHVRARRRGTRPPLPSIMYGNVRSIRNKTDELAANCKFNREYRDISMICITETWLETRDTDGTVNMDGFSLIRSDRTGTRKQHGGGVGIYINERWCKNVTIKQQYCDDNVEYLTISCRPFYMPREFNNIYVTVAYMCHPLETSHKQLKSLRTAQLIWMTTVQVE